MPVQAVDRHSSGQRRANWAHPSAVEEHSGSNPDRAEMPSGVPAREAGQLCACPNSADPEQVEHTPLPLLDHLARQVAETQLMNENRQLTSAQPVFGHNKSFRRPQ